MMDTRDAEGLDVYMCERRRRLKKGMRGREEGNA